MQRLDGKVVALVFAAAACGAPASSGSGPDHHTSGSRWRPASGVVPAAGSYVYLESEPGDPILAGGSRTYTPANASLYVSAVSSSGIAVNVVADVEWWGNFQAPPPSSLLQPAEFQDVQRYPSNDLNRGGLRWDGAGGRCDALGGWLVVDAVSLAEDGSVRGFDLRFEQRCSGSEGALHGQIHWAAEDVATESGPGTTAPPSTWAPSPGAIPGSGSYVYLESDAGDAVGGGRSYLYTDASAWIWVDAGGDRLYVSVVGAKGWAGSFRPMTGADRLQSGYYGSALHDGFQEPGQPALSWLGGDVSWPFVTGPIGWFAIDGVTYDHGILTGLDLRFEQHYESAAPALRGVIHWSGPWQPPPGLPADDHVYLESEPGEFVGVGYAYLYTPDMARVTVRSSGSRLTLGISRGDEWWEGELDVSTQSGLIEPGRYAVPLSDAGGPDAITWSHGSAGLGRSCDAVRGWIIVEDATYDTDVLTTVALRFESGCQGGAAALHGDVRWSAAGTMPGGDLWRPAPGATPTSGNFVYLESDPGDPIGVGQSHTYLQSEGQFGFHQDDVVFSGDAFSIDVLADEAWRGDFQVSLYLGGFDPGFYGHLAGIDFGDFYSTKLYWRGPGTGCSAVTSWLAIDRAEFHVKAFTALDLRFEQRCDGAPGVLHGQLHWTAEDAAAAGPVVPPPAAWSAPDGAMPPAGNAMFLRSDPDDYIGGGATTLYTEEDRITLATHGAVLWVAAAGWTGRFEAMPALAHLAPGFYGGLGGFQFAPSRGSLDWYGHGRGCNLPTGWFAVDGITADQGILTGADLRFEQHCEDNPQALRGQIRWTQEVWAPAPGATPPEGSFVYLESEPGEYVGAGQTYLFPMATAPFTVTAAKNVVTVTIPGPPLWSGRFHAPGGLDVLVPGTFADLGSNISIVDPLDGGLDWDGDGRAGSGGGWFILDRVAYSSGALNGIDLRFEQRSGAGPALHGLIHWDAP
jgi:hypothetical protein